jgi:hypothetical protein
MNKFDALKQFQSWPREWQELCSEYWVEAGDQVAGVSLAMPNEPFPFDQPKAAPKVAALDDLPRRRFDYTEQEVEYMDILIHSGVKPSRFVQAFVKRFPNNEHPSESLRSRYYKRRRFLKKRGEIK